MIQLADIYRILNQHRQKYRWLDVFSEDVAELQQGSAVRFTQTSEGNTYTVPIEGETMSLRVDRESGVVRFELAESPEVGTGAAGALAGAALGAAIAGSGRSSDAPAGAVFGLLIGGLLGAAAGAADRPKQVLTLRFDEDQGEWRLYHGPYTRWAKEALRPAWS